MNWAEINPTPTDTLRMEIHVTPDQHLCAHGADVYEVIGQTVIDGETFVVERCSVCGVSVEVLDETE